MAMKIQFKRATEERWAEVNPILDIGEPGFVKDSNRFKLGDGVTHWNDLDYAGENNVVNRPTHYDFPSVGKENTIYKAEQEKLCYQWNSTSLQYEKLIMSEGGISDIEIIYGGNANGTT